MIVVFKQNKIGKNNKYMHWRSQIFWLGEPKAQIWHF